MDFFVSSLIRKVEEALKKMLNTAQSYKGFYIQGSSTMTMLTHLEGEESCKGEDSCVD